MVKKRRKWNGREGWVRSMEANAAALRAGRGASSPRRAKRSAPRRAKTATHGRPRRASSVGAVEVTPMGRILAVEYLKPGSRRGHRHDFTGRATLYRTKCGKHLIIAPVNAGRFIHG